MFNKKLKKEMREIIKEIAHVTNLNNELIDIVDRNDAKVREILAERDKLREIVRNQTGADLLVAALKAVGVIRER
jgi:hypothetical protein